MQLDGVGAPEETINRALGLAADGCDTAEEQHNDIHASQASGKIIRIGRRGLKLVPLRLGSSDQETREDDPEPPSPVDGATFRFVQSITAPGPGGRSLWEDFEDSVASPTFSAFPPGATNSEPESSAQDTSVDHRIDSPIPTTTTDESSGSRSSLTSSSLSEGEDTTGHSSVSLSPPSVTATQKDEISSEEHTKEPPQSKD